MVILKRLIGVYLILIALAVSVNWIVTPLVDNSSGDYPIWVALNWFMAPAVTLALIVNVVRKFRLQGNERRWRHESVPGSQPGVLRLHCSRPLVVLELVLLPLSRKRTGGRRFDPPGVVGIHQPADGSGIGRDRIPSLASRA